MRFHGFAAALLMPALLICGCSDTSPPAAPAGSGRTPTTVPASSQGPSFADWRGRLEHLLTPELAAQTAQRPVEEAETRTFGDSLSYRWPSPRTTEYAGMKVPKKDVVGVSALHADVTPENFHARFFAEVTDEQRRMIDAQVRAQAAKQGLDAEQTALTQGLAASLLKKDPAEPMSGLGDAAAWSVGKHGSRLHVLRNGSLITIEVDVSDDAERNKTAAVALARTLLARL